VVNFVGHRRFVFRSAGGALHRQVFLFAAVEAMALALNGILYEHASRLLPIFAQHELLLRLITTNLVFLGFSYPLWRRVFKARASAA
jgi:putative flippase GtrA